MNERIFISYARSDGSAAAEAMFQLLKENGHSAWHDLRELNSDRSVWVQIEDKLKCTEFLVIIVTPAALKSDYIRTEWREARRNGATIMPVMAMEQSRSSLPRWLSRGEVYDLKEVAHWEKFAARLASVGRTFRADWDDGLKIETFITRPKLLAQIKAQLLSETAEPVSLTSALQGRGGYGKSVLAGEIARDPEVRDAYIDGVFWVDLGQENPDVLGKINHLIKRISGTGGAPDVNAAAEELRRLLEKRDVLIILDDVWRRQDLYPFAKATGGGNATLLATTRKLDVLPPSAKAIDISGMESEEALGLLSFGLTPDTTEHAALTHFVAEFWHWPQLLAIVNGLLRGRLRDGDTLEHALATITAGARKGVVPGADERDRTIANVMQMGIDDLPDPDRVRFLVLAVLPEDTAIPVAILAPLWGMQEYEAEEFARLLLDRRLIQSRDLSNPAVGCRIRMHDDMLWYLRSTTDDAVKQGLHSEFLEKHRPASENWADLNKEKPALHYLWRHLLWHLEQAGNRAASTGLRIDYGWIKAKLYQLGIDALLEDYRPQAKDKSAALVGNALNLSCLALEQDRGQLGFQMFGRLNHLLDDELAGFCDFARNDAPLFDPVLFHLNPPGAELIRLRGDDDLVTSVGFSCDGSLIVSAGHDGTSRFWDAVTGAAMGNTKGKHDGGVASVAFAPDASLIVSGGYDNMLRLWNTVTGVAMGRPLQGHEDAVLSVAFSPDGSHIISGSRDNTLRLWESATGKAIGRPLRGHADSVNSVAFSPDGSHIVSGSADGTLRRWDAITGLAVGQPMLGHQRSVRSVTFSSDSNRIISGGYDDKLRIWDTATGSKIGGPLCGHTGGVYSVAVSPDGNLIASAGNGGMLRLWDAKTGFAHCAPLRGYDPWTNSVAFSPDSRRIVSGGRDGTVRLWDTAICAAQGADLAGHEGKVRCLAVSPDGKSIVSGGSDSALRLWDAATGASLGQPLRGHESGLHGVYSVAFSPDNSRIVSSGEDRTLRLWDAVTGVARGEPLRGHASAVLSVAFSPDGSRIVSGGWDKTLRLWNAATGATLSEPLRGHSTWVNYVAFSPDGSRIVSEGHEERVLEWEAATNGEIRGPFDGDKLQGLSTVLSPDGSRIIRKGSSQRAQLYDVATGAALGEPLYGVLPGPLRVAFSPDGRRIVGGGENGTLRIWSATTGRLEDAIYFDGDISGIAVLQSQIIIGDALGNIHILRWRTSD